jgi:transcription antitermination factor NusG
MSERENGQLPLAKRTVRNRIAPDVLGAIKTLNTKGKISRCYYRQKSAGGANVYLKTIFRELGVCNPVIVNVTQSSALLALLDEPVWFCLKAQPKREHLAAVALRRQFGIECFSPRLRFRKMTNRGPVWFVEAMFPGYLFAKFVYSKQHRAIEASHGIRGIVHFGDYLATLPENIVVGLQSRVGAEEVVTIDSSIKIGQAVQIVEGPFRGLEVVVTCLLPAKERVRVLFDFLGRSIEMEVSTTKVLAA